MKLNVEKKRTAVLRAPTSDANEYEPSMKPKRQSPWCWEPTGTARDVLAGLAKPAKQRALESSGCSLLPNLLHALL